MCPIHGLQGTHTEMVAVKANFKALTKHVECGKFDIIRTHHFSVLYPPPHTRARACNMLSIMLIGC